MKRFKIYANYGVLGAEKKTVYTYAAEQPTATTSEIITVELPENDYFSLYETTDGVLRVSAAWGWDYSIDEILREYNNAPEFYAADKNYKIRTTALNIIREGK